MAKHPETRQMETAVERIAAANRGSTWTKDDVLRMFLKRNAPKKQELEALSELDRRTQAVAVLPGLEAGPEAFEHVHRDRELARLTRLASRVMQKQMEEDYGLHRRFGAFSAPILQGKGERTEWRWFEIRYARPMQLQMWRDMKDELRIRIGITIEETDVILSLARARQAQTINAVYRDAMNEIQSMRARAA